MNFYVRHKPAIFSNGTINYPLLGIISTIIGTVFAVSSIQSKLVSEWALFNSALLMSICLMIAPIAAALRDPKSVLRCEHLLALGPIYWLLLDLIQGAYSMEDVQPESIDKAFIGIGIFVISVWLAASYPTKSIPRFIAKSTSLEFSGDTYFVILIAAFIFGMLRFAIPCNFNIIEMVRYLGESRWAAPWSRGQLGGWDSFLDHIAYFGYLLPALTVIIARHVGWRNYRTIISILMTLSMTVFLMQGGGRRIIGVIFGVAFILWVLTESRLRIKHGIIAGVIIAILLVVMQLMVEYRTIGLSDLFVENKKKEKVFERSTLHVDDNFLRMCQIMEFIPKNYPYVYHKYALWVLVRPIPRVFWPDKPIDPGFDLPTAVGAKGVSYSCSVLGELYMSAGLIGIAIGGLIYGRLASLASKILMTGKSFGSIVIYGIFVMALFAGLRSMLELVLTSYAIIAWIVLSRAIAYFRGHKKIPKRTPDDYDFIESDKSEFEPQT